MKAIKTNLSPTSAEEPLTSVRNFASSWDRFWFKPSDPTTVGLMRLLGGIVILYIHFCYSFDLLSYVSPREAWLDREITDYLRNDRPVLTFPDDWPGRGAVLTKESLDAMSVNGVPEYVLTALRNMDEKEFESKIQFRTKLQNTLSTDDWNRYGQTVLNFTPSRVPEWLVAGKGQNSWSIFFHLEEPGSIWTAHLLILFVMLLFTLGYATRITATLALIGAISYQWRAPTSLFGMDAIVVAFLFYMQLAPCGAALSLDRWLEVRRERKRLRDPNAVVPLLPLASATFATRMMQIQFCFIYGASGTAKLLGASWWNGNALWACYANYSFAPLRVELYQKSLEFLCEHRWLWEIFMSGGVLFTLFLELGFPYLIWLKRWRWFMLSGSVMLHTGIGIFMGLVTFSLMMLCLVLAFVPPEASRLFVSRLAENWRRLRHAVFSNAKDDAGKPLPAPAR